MDDQRVFQRPAFEEKDLPDGRLVDEACCQSPHGLRGDGNRVGMK